MLKRNLPNSLALKFGCFPISLYRDLILKEINIAKKWPRPQNRLKDINFKYNNDNNKNSDDYNINNKNEYVLMNFISQARHSPIYTKGDHLARKINYKIFIILNICMNCMVLC